MAVPTFIISTSLIAVLILMLLSLLFWIRHRVQAADKPSVNRESAPQVNFHMIDTNADYLVGFCCYVCMDYLPHTGNVVRLQCGHHYHRRCIHQWLNTSPGHECPSCGARVQRRSDASDAHVVIDLCEPLPRDVPRAALGS